MSEHIALHLDELYKFALASHVEKTHKQGHVCYGMKSLEILGKTTQLFSINDEIFLISWQKSIDGKIFLQ